MGRALVAGFVTRAARIVQRFIGEQSIKHWWNGRSEATQFLTNVPTGAMARTLQVAKAGILITLVSHYFRFLSFVVWLQK